MSEFMKKGFTLIELLAVIVILAIIALIATPIVLNIIKDSKESAQLNSAGMYVDAVEQAVAKEKMNDTTFSPNTCDIQSKGNLECDNVKDVTVKVKGEVPTSGTITFTKGKVDQVTLTYKGNKTITKDSSGSLVYKEDIKIEEEQEPTNIKTYEVYFDVEKGITCTKEEYEKSYGTATISKFVYGGEQEISYYETITVTDYLNSLSGYNGFNNKTNFQKTTITDKFTLQNSCLKFYAYDDGIGETVNLILDHNTTDVVAWSQNFGDGPTYALESLQSDTSSWVGTETPTNYSIPTITLAFSGGYKNYQYDIDYTGYKARLITAEEIAQITGYSNWNIKITSFNLDRDNDTCYYKYDSTTETYISDTSGCKYGWLYDRTGQICTDYGCLYNTQSDIVGYWTATASTYIPALIQDFTAMMVSQEGGLTSKYYSNQYEGTGIRPVIEVLRSKLN